MIKISETKLRTLFKKHDKVKYFIDDCKREEKLDREELRDIVEYYKKIRGYDKINKWDKIHFGRAMRYAKQLSQIFENTNKVKKAIDIQQENMDEANLTWNLATVVKHSDKLATEIQNSERRKIGV